MLWHRHWDLHDLRHQRCLAAGVRQVLGLQRLHYSFASHVAARSETLPMIGKLLGHSHVTTTARYAHLDDGQVIEASQQIGDLLKQAMGDKNKWHLLDKGPNARRAVLMKAADALESRKDAFVDAMMGEIGATAGWAMFNLGLAAGMVREAAALTTQISGEVIPSDKPGCLAMALREPVGVILGIAPWNAPIILGVRAVAVPLACGNSVILKASENCPRTHELIIEAFAEAGFPDGVVNIVTNALTDAGDVVGALIDHPAVKRVNFTGSTNVGRIICQARSRTSEAVRTGTWWKGTSPNTRRCRPR